MSEQNQHIYMSQVNKAVLLQNILNTEHSTSRVVNVYHLDSPILTNLFNQYSKHCVRQINTAAYMVTSYKSTLIYSNSQTL